MADVLSGRDLDVAVAEDVFGLKVLPPVDLFGQKYYFCEDSFGSRNSVPAYSSFRGEEVATAMRLRYGGDLHIKCDARGSWTADTSEPHWSGWWTSTSMSTAICLAAVAAVRKARAAAAEEASRA